MKFELEFLLGKKRGYVDKDIPQEVLDNPFLLGLFVSSMSTGIRDALKREFEAAVIRWIC